MPTLVEVQIPASSQQDVSDASETILHDESTILVDDNEMEEDKGLSQSRRNGSSSPVQRPGSRRSTGTLPEGDAIMGDQNDTFDGSVTILSRTLLSHDDTRQFEGEESLLDISRVRDEPTETNSKKNIRLTSDKMGPHQDLYRTKYQGFVKSTIRNFEKRFPGRLRDYRTMSLEEKEQEQQNVLGLLARLGISNGAGQNPDRNTIPSQQGYRKVHQSPSRSERRRNLNDTMSPLLSPEYHRNTSNCGNSFCMGDESPIPRASSNTYQDKSLVAADQPEMLLSPAPSPIEQKESPQFLGPGSDYTDCPMNMSSESVELVRAEKSFSSYSNSLESPERLRPNPHKRQASSSAKRGADLVRHKYNQEATPPLYDPGRDPDSEIALSSHMERLSMSPTPSSPGDLFGASQSPISPRLTYGSSENEESSDDEGGRISLEHRSDHMRKHDDTINTFSSVSRYRPDYDNKEKRRAMREIPVNVRMKTGATFHLNKLDMKRTEHQQREAGKKVRGKQRRRLVDFPDPFVRYNRRQREVFNDIFRWIHDSECENRGQGRGVLLSLSYEQIVDLCLKLLLNDEPNRRLDSTKESNSCLQGQTAVVVRTKEDATKWESALREGTGCSVLNHATLPLSERIRTSTAEKAVLHDVVLTTFDAMKSPDIAVPVDELGHAMLTKIGSDKGWYSSRTASQTDSVPQKCNQLSVLHRVNFKRIVFVDALGRKSFIAKEGTARASASVALRGDSRLVFFSSTEVDGIAAMVALRKSHRGAIRSLSAVLHLDYDQDGEENDEDGLENHMLDLKELC